MARRTRIQIPAPDPVCYQTQTRVRITDVNYGGHLANDALLSLTHDIRCRWLGSLGVAEDDLGGVGLILTQAFLEYKAECFFDDSLDVKLGIINLHRFGFEIVYQFTREATSKESARVLTTQVGFDYRKKKLAPMPGEFAAKLEAWV